jgi:hypothetical protein
MRKFVWIDNGRGDYEPQIWTDPLVGPELKVAQTHVIVDDKLTLEDCIALHPKPEYIVV